ncbi:MAG: phage terminase large subunit [Chloroflexi bacterium]|nr:phage terminase large subunit [Chloroflexota bacterium]
MATSGAPRSEVRLRYQPFGVAQAAFTRRDPEVVLDGPAGTGKTRGLLEKLHLCACKYAGMRGLIARKTHASLTGSALVTYQRRVLHPLDGVKFFGGSAVEPPQFQYPNGSKILVGGLDKPMKIMSTEYDMVYVNEATELTVNDWESITTRLRNGVMPYQQIIADCNPDAPAHWLRRRADAGTTVMLPSRHEDNPSLWDAKAGRWTVQGAAYIAKLDALTGVRFLRLRRGIWAAAEGMVYDGWDPATHRVYTFEIPKTWPRYWTVDFGYTNPFVWQAWAEDTDGRLFRYREIYRTQGLVEDHAEVIKAATKGEPRPVAIICDHDAEDRATLSRKLGLPTVAAYKSVSPGIQAVAARLRPAGDGRPRLFLLRDALVEQDPLLVEAKKPTSTEEEIEGYVWNTAAGRKKGDEPVKKDDHGMDAMRYLVAFVDSLADDPEITNEFVVYDDRVIISDY